MLGKAKHILNCDGCIEHINELASKSSKIFAAPRRVSKAICGALIGHFRGCNL